MAKYLQEIQAYHGLADHRQAPVTSSNIHKMEVSDTCHCL